MSSENSLSSFFRSSVSGPGTPISKTTVLRSVPHDADKLPGIVAHSTDWPRGAPETKQIPFEVHFLNIEAKPTFEIAGAGTAQLSPYVIVEADHLPDNHFRRAANGWG
ncbi:hypothetical protein IFM46972_01689 [Aspergillus udagawae]|uniref:Uncharacterized protein n=1 Tax=Aspergillus udagawae TaxID=91492 RepID=A0A8H3N477_9EURO|nr:hypothetical protein IFM46972_01689 [Aspergillus udagawae]